MDCLGPPMVPCCRDSYWSNRVAMTGWFPPLLVFTACRTHLPLETPTQLQNTISTCRSAVFSEECRPVLGQALAAAAPVRLSWTLPSRRLVMLLWLAGLTLDPNGRLYRGPSGRPRTQPPQLGMLLRARASSGVAGTVGQTSPGVVRRRWCPLQASMAVLGFHFCCCLLVRIEFSDVWDPCLVCVYQAVAEVIEDPKGVFMFLLIV
ncbi:hypothetical protein E2C01_008736 [Portunus trituberculatus]|uniref:Uncharacterized protein n=1 Tax=Portunus trituberculatus TaxID=210409 RepID=A0A5B7D2M2_PORTR|nr:hypothetical protein [Portunus trituberculatus]